MNKFKQGLNKVIKFLRKNIYYVLIIVCIAAIGTMITVTLARDKHRNSNLPTIVTPDDKPIVTPGGDDPTVPVDDPNSNKPKPVVFVNPVANATISKNYSEVEAVYSKTLNQWSTHLGIDFVAEEGSAVVAVYDGYVAEIINDTMYGNVVTINHANGLSTKYYSLGDNVAVNVGQTITAGTKIGEISTSMLVESSDGAHLHFETLVNNSLVDPSSYFVTNNK